MSTPITPAQREELRAIVREQLVAAQSVALPAAAITRRVNHTRVLAFEASEEEVGAALRFLESLGQAQSRPHTLGSTVYWQATAAGILAHERGE